MNGLVVKKWYLFFIETQHASSPKQKSTTTCRMNEKLIDIDTY